MRTDNLRMLLVMAVGATGAFMGCGGDEEPAPACKVSEPTTTCGAAKVCEDMAGQPTCVAPVVVRGRVIDTSGRPIGGALVTALDGNDAPTTGTATSAIDGRFELRVPVPRMADGALSVRQVKLRASAAGFETFPSGVRRSFPIELSGAVAVDGGRLAVQSSATDVTLAPIANPGTLGSIAGTVAGPAGKRGVLVVAEGPSTATAISDIDGDYVIFNVTPGEYTVRGYAAGVQLQSASATVLAGARAGAVDLSPRAVPLGTISGSVNIVNAAGGSMTSVVLVVASTYNPDWKRGEVPPGLRTPIAGAPSISGAFSIIDVPDGEYKVLAAFENDNLVRDPDTSIGGTQVQGAVVGDASRQITLAASFKLTGALTVVRPGAGETPELMTGAVTFTWADDSSEELYKLDVLDSRGNLVWSTDIPKQTGGEVQAAYGGPALQSGSYYQFRVTSYRRVDVPISQTEDLRGVFLVQ